MTSRLFFLFILPLSLVWSISNGQCVVKNDYAGRLVTICNGYQPKAGFFMNRPDQSQTPKTTVYLGSPYLTFPVYEDGVLEVNHYQTSCKIAFNLVTHQVLCRFESDSIEHAVLPDAFRVGAQRFVRKSGPQGPPVYYKVLYAGKSKVLAQIKGTLQETKREAYRLEEFDGIYTRQERYLIELENKAPQAVTLSRKSVLRVLDHTSDPLPSTTLKNKLTVPELIEAVAAYDGFQ
ncbi:hypothetical protein LX87_05625 [Larkinella arboricola]|uniref:GLPGLI family protein n=1 Tax=Larkinella arboricola TaxID=643671 RepID=A0A327WH17_LARAB|nr:hypothetical protein [Larkinella arboricola]RAJ89891.1 hypothetical protein LX87_05625 [Larkinella arboricola]